MRRGVTRSSRVLASVSFMIATVALAASPAFAGITGTTGGSATMSHSIRVPTLGSATTASSSSSVPSPGPSAAQLTNALRQVIAARSPLGGIAPALGSSQPSGVSPPAPPVPTPLPTPILSPVPVPSPISPSPTPLPPAAPTSPPVRASSAPSGPAASGGSAASSAGQAPGASLAPGPLASASPAAPSPSSVGPAPSLGPSLRVAPDTNLRNGQAVTVTGSGFVPNSQGSLSECNDTVGAPTINFFGYPFPIGCTTPLQAHTTTDGFGRFSTSFSIRAGTVGPPARGTDSAGQSAASAAAGYPCPPTALQIAVGDTCQIVYIDAAGEKAVAPITFASQGVPPAIAPSGGAASTPSGGASAGGTSPASGPGSIPFTGFGAGLWHLSEIGGVLSCLGCALILAARRTRRAGATSQVRAVTFVRARLARVPATGTPGPTLWVGAGGDRLSE